MPNTNIKIKNMTGSTKIWGGQTIDASSEYTLQDLDRKYLINDDKFRQDLQSGIVKVFNGSTLLDSTYGLMAISLDSESFNKISNGLSKPIREKIYRINVYNDYNNLESETWYDTTDIDGSYSGISLQTLYSYKYSLLGKADLLSKTENTYYYDGSIASSFIHEYYRDNDKIVEKVREN